MSSFTSPIPTQEMSRELCHQQEALWELLTTELIYVRKLKIMTDVSQPPPSQRPQPWHHPPSPRPEQGRVVGEGGAGYREPPAQGLGREVCGTEDGGGNAVKGEAGVREEETRH